MPVTRRALLSAAPALLSAQTRRRGRPPNVLIMITDDQGYGDFSLHGNPHLKTPNLDSIARQGVQFNHFQVSPVCSPTRSSLMTGRYNYRTGVVDTYLGRSMMHADEMTMAEYLSRAGYHTGIFGKWHLGDNFPMRAHDQGFEEALTHNGGGIGQPSDPPGNSYFDPILQHNGKPERHEGYCTDIFFREAIRFIERHRRDRWLAYVSTNAPHDPLTVRDEWAKPFLDQGLDLATARTYAMVANIDTNVGRLLKFLSSAGLERDTLLIFLTDNGPQRDRYNAGMRGRKGTIYQGGIRVPLFLRWPARVQPGSKIDRIAAHIDLLPTILDACGVSPSGPKMDGLSLLPLIAGDDALWPDRTLFTQWHRGDEPELFRACAARTQRYKLVNGSELYDLAADPAEQRDLSSERPEIAANLRRRTEDWFRDVSSTRGYAPPRIHLGAPAENPSILTRQDWRGPRAGWTPDSLGHWEVEITAAGRYDVRVRIAPVAQPARVRLKIGPAEATVKIPAGAAEAALGELTLPAGPARLEAIVETGGREIGVHYVDVKRL